MIAADIAVSVHTAQNKIILSPCRGFCGNMDKAGSRTCRRHAASPAGGHDIHLKVHFAALYPAGPSYYDFH